MMEPRVLTVEELHALPRLAIVFIECWDGELKEPLPTIFAGMKCYDGTIVDEDGAIFQDFEDDMKPTCFDGSMWRFWNMMPTEEQRKRIEWEWQIEKERVIRDDRDHDEHSAKVVREDHEPVQTLGDA